MILEVIKMGEFSIVNFEIEKDVKIYYECFQDSNFVKVFGYDPSTFHIIDYLKVAVLTKYPSVERYLLYRNGHCVGFCHCCIENNHCEILGGLEPKSLYNGYGLYFFSILLSKLQNLTFFKSFICYVSPINTKSIKFLKAFGFDYVDSDRDRVLKFLLPKSFKSHIYESIIRKLSHE